MFASSYASKTYCQTWEFRNTFMHARIPRFSVKTDGR